MALRNINSTDISRSDIRKILPSINRVFSNSLYGAYGNDAYREQKELTGDKIGVFQYVKLNSYTTQNNNRLEKVAIKVNEISRFGLKCTLYEPSGSKCSISTLHCYFKYRISNVKNKVIIKELEDLFTLERLANI